jgi:cleavage and polyadenylation specificity factor subunit 2
MITLTPLSASASSSSTSEPVAYYLELDDACILLDMGQRDYRSSTLADNWEYEQKIRE